MSKRHLQLHREFTTVIIALKQLYASAEVLAECLNSFGAFQDPLSVHYILEYSLDLLYKEEEKKMKHKGNKYQ